MKTPVLAIVGPTASGKSDAALRLAERLGGEIVSADSVQVYRGLDIGSAKPGREERARIPHHLIDVADPDEDFSVARYQELASAAVDGAWSRGRLPIVVGGTGLYVRALLRNYLFHDVPPDPEFRRRMRAEAEASGRLSLHLRLQRIDSAAAARIHPNNLKRVIRALEVYHLTGKTMTELEGVGEDPYDDLLVGLHLPRKSLYNRIDRRVDEMLERGLVEEVKGLWERGYSLELPSLRTIGYREVGDYLMGRTGYNEMQRLIKRNTRRYAKRQLTWFRAERGIEWVEAGKTSWEEILGLVAAKWKMVYNNANLLGYSK